MLVHCRAEQSPIKPNRIFRHRGVFFITAEYFVSMDTPAFPHARSIGHLSEITKVLQAKKADLQVLAMGLDTSTATGRLMLNVIGSVAQFEREMMLERQREGIAKAKLQGKYKGRKATARAKAATVLELRAKGLGPSEIARQACMGRASVYRILEGIRQ